MLPPLPPRQAYLILRRDVLTHKTELMICSEERPTMLGTEVHLVLGKAEGATYGDAAARLVRDIGQQLLRNHHVPCGRPNFSSLVSVSIT